MNIRFNSIMNNRLKITILSLIVLVTGCAIVKKSKNPFVKPKGETFVYNSNPYPVVIRDTLKPFSEFTRTELQNYFDQAYKINYSKLIKPEFDKLENINSRLEHDLWLSQLASNDIRDRGKARVDTLQKQVANDRIEKSNQNKLIIKLYGRVIKLLEDQKSNEDKDSVLIWTEIGGMVLIVLLVSALLWKYNQLAQKVESLEQSLGLKAPFEHE